MGCVATKEAKKSNDPIPTSLTAQMTAGEALDHKLQHSKIIQNALELARLELAGAENKWVWDNYMDETKLLGRGAFARVFLARQKGTKQLVAIKVIQRDSKFFEQQKRAMVTKIACMRNLQGHRSMVHLYEVYEDEQGYHVVLEYMPARPLFDAIVAKGHFSEADAAHVMRQLLQFLSYMHERNIVHRDIKPENLMLLKPRQQQPGNGTAAAQGSVTAHQQHVGGDDDDDDEPQLPYLTPEEEGLVDEAMWADVPDGLRLKVIDYGTANFCEAGQHLHSKIGTARYVAPEVLARDYDKSSDIWSAGVVLFILLCGHAPFNGATNTGTLAKVKQGNYTLSGPEWQSISASAKDLLSHMLVPASQRWTAEELLQHIWFHEAIQQGGATGSSAHQDGYLRRLTNFAGMCRMKRLALKLLAHEESTLTMAEVDRLKRLFAELDTDGDGLIDGHALHAGLAAVGCELSKHDVKEFLAVSRVDCMQQPRPTPLRKASDSGAAVAPGLVDINEFIAALFDAERVMAANPAVIEEEFARLDVDHDGFITAEDLVAASRAAAAPANNSSNGINITAADRNNSIAALLCGQHNELTLSEAEDILSELAGMDSGALHGPTAVNNEDDAGSKAQTEQGGAIGLSLKDFRDMMTHSKTGRLPRLSLDVGNHGMVARAASPPPLVLSTSTTLTDAHKHPSDLIHESNGSRDKVGTVMDQVDVGASNGNQ